MAHDLVDEVIGGFYLGADDYITKPFSIRIVIDKIMAVLRRCSEIEVMRTGSDRFRRSE